MTLKSPSSLEEKSESGAREANVILSLFLTLYNYNYICDILGCCAVSRKKMKKIKKNSEYKFSIVSMKHQENQIPNIFSWTKSYIPNTAVPVALASDYKTI